MKKVFLFLIVFTVSSRSFASLSAVEILRACAANYDFSKLTSLELNTTYGSIYFSEASPSIVKTVRRIPLFNDTQSILIDSQKVLEKEFVDAAPSKIGENLTLDFRKAFGQFKKVTLLPTGKYQEYDCDQILIEDFASIWPLFSLFSTKPASSVKATLWIDKKTKLLHKVEANVIYRLRDQGSETFVLELGKQRKFQNVFIPESYQLSIKDLATSMPIERKNSLKAMNFNEGTEKYEAVQYGLASMDTLTDPKHRSKQERRTQYKQILTAIIGLRFQIEKSFADGEAGFKIRLLQTLEHKIYQPNFFKLN